MKTTIIFAVGTVVGTAVGGVAVIRMFRDPIKEYVTNRVSDAVTNSMEGMYRKLLDNPEPDHSITKTVSSDGSVRYHSRRESR